MANGKETFGKVTSWLGVFCGVFTIIVWCFLLKALSPKIEVNENDAIDDTNKANWRDAMFTFAPTVFFDVWTPFVMGAISILCHFRPDSLKFMSKTFIHFFFWNFVMALFGNMGYAGGVGVICSAFTFLCTLFSLICIFLVPNQSPKLGLRLPQRR